jgi:hypothetical protein
LLENSLELFFCLAINDRQRWYAEDAFSVKFNLVVDWIFTVLLVLSPVIIVCFYCYNFEKLGNTNFNQTWGATYTGLYYFNRRILFFPISFLLRRATFALLSLHMSTFVIG